MNRRLAVAATTLCLLAATVATAAPASAGEPAPTGASAAAQQAAAAGPGPASLRGSAGAVLDSRFAGFAGDPVRFGVDARADGATGATTRGHFHVRHVHSDGRLVADFEGDITCLAVGGHEAVATGVVTKGEAPWFPGRSPVGQKVALSVEDNGRHGDRIGWVWGFFGQPVSDCQGTVPFIRTTSGDFTVRG
ncbi:hypothetical protein ACIG5E_23940 [Kitasatospora sp. NPDC053057]|uniref:hypothetical protein n=1 Tax=Kitasatospora sp. NPDC053057 TaxID=3364062 RepID=UPI0037C86897